MYLSVVFEENDSSELMHALNVLARARGMTEVARAAGLTREALYKSAAPELAAALRHNRPGVPRLGAQADDTSASSRMLAKKNHA